MKTNHLLSVFSVFLLVGCTVNREAVIPQNGTTPIVSTPVVPGLPPEQRLRVATGEWTAARGVGGGAHNRDPNFNTFKNFQYTFDVVGANKIVKVSLSSADIDVQFALYNPLGQLIKTSSLSRTVSEEFTLNEGKYRIVVCAARRAVGRFSLNVLGVNSELGLIPSEILQSDTQNWGLLGGGGNAKTFKNHFYTFEVTDDNTSVDIELESPDANVALHLYDELGTRIALENGQRYGFILRLTKKGIYTVMAGTNTRGSVGNYRLNIFGKIKNLQRIPSNAETKTGSWATGKSADTYSLEINSSNNSPLDLELSSGDIDVWLELQNGVGDRITFQHLNRKEFIVSNDLPKGTYRIYVRPYPTTGAGGNYTLQVHGQFVNLKKL